MTPLARAGTMRRTPTAMNPQPGGTWCRSGSGARPARRGWPPPPGRRRTHLPSIRPAPSRTGRRSSAPRPPRLRWSARRAGGPPRPVCARRATARRMAREIRGAPAAEDLLADPACLLLEPLTPSMNCVRSTSTALASTPRHSRRSRQAWVVTTKPSGTGQPRRLRTSPRRAIFAPTVSSCSVPTSARGTTYGASGTTSRHSSAASTASSMSASASRSSGIAILEMAFRFVTTAWARP